MSFFSFRKAALLSLMLVSTSVHSSIASPIDEIEFTDHGSRISYDDSEFRDDRGRIGRFFRNRCNDQAVNLLCKINGRHRWVTGYTNCGRVRDGSYCRDVYVPGFRAIKMIVEYRCESGYLRWTLGEHGACKLVY